MNSCGMCACFRNFQANDTRGQQERSTEYTEEVKWLHESCIVFRCVEFNQSGFDKTITFASLTIARILLRLPGWNYYSVSLFPIRWTAHSAYSVLPLSIRCLGSPHGDFDTAWIRSHREALAPHWEFSSSTPEGTYLLNKTQLITSNVIYRQTESQQEAGGGMWDGLRPGERGREAGQHMASLRRLKRGEH